MANWHGVNILIVEDSATQAAWLERCLKGRGCGCVIKSDGVKAWEYLQNNTPTIIISDIMMPEMDGYELCKKIRQDHRFASLPVILLTSLFDPEDVIKALEAGADNFLTKPCNEELLYAHIQNALDDQRLQTEMQKMAPQGNTEMQFSSAGQLYNVITSPLQVIRLLISTYSNAVQKNMELQQANQQLTQIQEELMENNTILAKLNEENKQYVGMAAHDLRNPLTLISGYASILVKKLADKIEPKHLECLNVICESGRHMLNIIDQMLDVSKIEAGKLSLSIEKHDLHDLLAQCIRFNTTFAEQKGIALNYEAPDVPMLVDCDSHRITQVFDNLISNALKFSPAQSRITLKLLPGENEVMFSIRDEGRGIPKEEIDKAFQPFEQTSTKSTAGEPSTGLGLAICKKIITAHSGKIWVDSELNNGCTFYVSLPTAMASLEAALR